MVLKKMKLVAKSLLTNNDGKRIGIFEMGFGQQYAVFAKEIIDKYAKVLNYHFDYTALVFLDQVAEMRKGQQTSANVVNLAWSLLSFLFKEERHNNVNSQRDFVAYQIIKQVEDCLEKIKKEELPVYHDLTRCYALYQKVYKEKNDKEKMTESKVIEETTRYIEEQMKHSMLFRTTENKEKVSIIPGTMNKAFFNNLNHVMNENKVMDYQQIWKKSVTQQLDQYYLDICMKAFIKEEQIDRKQEYFYDMFQSFDEDTIQTYLIKADKNIYTHFVEYMMTVIDTRNIIKKTDESIMVQRQEMSREEEIELKKIELKEKTEEYKNIYNDIMNILGETQEITRNIIVEKSREYKELFYEYIQSENEQYEDMKMIPDINQDTKNPQIFSSDDIELLLKEENKKQKETYSKEFYSKELQQRITFLKEKLNLLAIREVIERCLAEDTGILHREKVIDIANILENVDFQSNSGSMEADLENGKVNIAEVAKVNIAEMANVSIVFDKGTLPERKLLYLAIQEGIDEVLIEQKENRDLQKKILELKNKIVQEEDYERRSKGDWRFLMKKDRSMEIIKAIEELTKEEKRWLEEKMIGMQEKTKVLQQSMEADPENGKVNAAEVAKVNVAEMAKVNIAEMADVSIVFDKGTLPERKLLYLAIQEGIDEVLIEQKENRVLQKKILELKNKIVQEEDYEKRSKGDWRFLMKKDRSMEIVKAIEELTKEEKRWVEEKMIGMQEKTKVLRQSMEADPENGKVNAAEVAKVNVAEMADVSIVFDKGTLPERKLLYLAIQEGIDEVLIEQKENRDLQKKILELKNKIVQEEDYEKRSKGDWRFLMKKDRSMEIIKAIEELTIEEKRWVEEKMIGMQEKTKVLRQSMEADPENGKVNAAEVAKVNVAEMEKVNIAEMAKVNIAEMADVSIVFDKGTLPERKLLYLAIQEGIDEVLIEQKENRDLQKKILELKNKIVQEEDYEKRSKGDWRFLMKKDRSMEIVKAIEELTIEEKRWVEEKMVGMQEKIQKEELKIIPQYFKIMWNPKGDKGEKYALSHYLRRNQRYPDAMEEFGYITHLSSQSLDFMEPPVNGLDRGHQVEVSEQQRYQERGVQIILKHTSNKDANFQFQKQDNLMETQEEVIKELERGLLECQIELKSRDERIDTLEKNIKNQEENIQVLKNKQDGMVRKIHSATDAKQVLNHIKGELQLEQMRRGKL